MKIPCLLINQIKHNMAKKCIYCKCQLSDDSVIDFCERCGVGVWGPNMFKAIKANMEEAQDRGDLFQDRS
jgi:hypothetical protein